MVLFDKKILYGGRGENEYPDGTKLTFHYAVKLASDLDKVIDDSRKCWPHGYGKPVEIVLGKQFKLASWELCLKSMKCSEVSLFTLQPQDYLDYPFVAKQLRDLSKAKVVPGSDGHVSVSKCSMSLQMGTGYPELDKLMKSTETLMFTFELLSVELPDTYEPDSWQLSAPAKLSSLPELRNRGNEAFRAGDYAEACRYYSEAIERIETELWKERPGDEDYHRLDKAKIPFLLNIAQCKLSQEDYYAALMTCDEILTRDGDNVKGIWRRAKAHMGAWNFEKARTDWKRLLELSPELTKTVQAELQKLDAIEAEKEKEEKQKLSRLFS